MQTFFLFFQAPNTIDWLVSRDASVSRTFIAWTDLALASDVLCVDYPVRTNQ